MWWVLCLHVNNLLQDYFLPMSQKTKVRSLVTTKKQVVRVKSPRMTREEFKNVSDDHLVVNDGPWTRFMDMHSGGGCKEYPFEYIYIQYPKDVAERVFYLMFGHNPDRVTCTCCGNDYSVDESKDLKQATGYNRSCAYNADKKLYIESRVSEYSHRRRPMGVKAYCTQENVLVIYKDMVDASNIPHELPLEGY